MNIDTFIGEFSEQFDNADQSLFSSKTKFRDLEEWDSLVALSIIAMIDEKYSTNLSIDEFRATNTIQELFNAVQKKLINE